MQVSEVEKPQTKLPDPRFESELFRQAVRRVLKDIAERPVFGNFKKYDKFIDWEVYAKRQKCLTRLDKNSEVIATNSVSRLSQKCPSTYKKTNTENNKRNNAVDLPLPAGGQASQLLEDRKAGVVVQIEQRKQVQLEALQAGEAEQTEVMT